MEQSVPKRLHIKFRRRKITRKKEYMSQKMHCFFFDCMKDGNLVEAVLAS
jgi:hypothetical protein